MGQLNEEHESYFDLQDAPFAGYSFRQADGSVWEIQRPLSKLKYQEEVIPFEARQVFTCVCLEDPTGKYREAGEAVAKVKYQIVGSKKTVEQLKENLQQCENRAKAYLSDDTITKITDPYVEEAKDFLYQATHPVQKPNIATRNEGRALSYFAKKKCAHVPHLITSGASHVKEGTDPLGMIGGYVRVPIMTKLPGQNLIDIFWGLPLDARDLVRDRFKAALLDVWKLRVRPRDCALRDILWDEKSGKCYIIDFEDWRLIRGTLNWYDTEYNAWQMSEMFKPVSSTYVRKPLSSNAGNIGR